MYGSLKWPHSRAPCASALRSSFQGTTSLTIPNPASALWTPNRFQKSHYPEQFLLFRIYVINFNLSSPALPPNPNPDPNPNPSYVTLPFTLVSPPFCFFIPSSSPYPSHSPTHSPFRKQGEKPKTFFYQEVNLWPCYSQWRVITWTFDLSTLYKGLPVSSFQQTATLLLMKPCLDETSRPSIFVLF